jgi:hypothetical protein
VAHFECGVSRLFATAMEAMPLIIDPRLVHPADSRQSRKLIASKNKEPLKAKLQSSIKRRRSAKQKKTAVKIVVPRRGIGSSKGEAHETS